MLLEGVCRTFVVHFVGQGLSCMFSSSNDLSIRTVCNIQSKYFHCGGHNQRIVTIRSTHVTSPRLYSRGEEKTRKRCSHFRSLTALILVYLQSPFPVMHLPHPIVLPIVHRVYIRIAYASRLKIDLSKMDISGIAPPLDLVAPSWLHT